jgi:hypothetical protein
MTNITSTIIQDSIHEGIRLTTFELEYPRFIHAELLTHRQFSRNSASSRAIPVARVNELLVQNPAEPAGWGKNQAGMTAGEEIEEKEQAKIVWHSAKESAVAYSRQLLDLGVHKQISNRITEPFQMIKVVLTATEFQNWFELRAHPDAQPEIQLLAQKMLERYNQSQPFQLQQGDWHVPYVGRQLKNSQMYYLVGNEEVTRQTARLVSASCCAQVSYRRLDQSLDKALLIAQRLVHGRPWHASPFEHQAKTILHQQSWEPGVTHHDRQGQAWSGNFKGWIQHRQMLEQA